MNFNNLIDLELTQYSGQTSQSPWRLDCESNSFNNVIIVDNIPVLLKLSQNNIDSMNLDYEIPTAIDESIIDKNKLESKIKSEVNRIYDLDYDLSKFYNYLKEDEKLAPSAEFCKGLRLFIAADPFESIIASISSSNNSIARWTKTIDKIKKIWGDEYLFPSGRYYKFPPSEVLMEAYENNLEEYEADNRQMEIECYTNNLKSCGLGYRVPYVKQASEIFTLEMDLNDFYHMSYDEAYNEIIKIKGVGDRKSVV